MVIRSLGDSSVNTIQQAVLQHMGAAYVPDEVITLPELGLTDFPKTLSGKVQGSRLAQLVRTFRDRRDQKHNESKRSFHNVVLHAYHKSTGLPVENLDLQTPVTNFADSISFMRVRDTLRKEIGVTLTVQEMIEYPSIQSQIWLLQGRDSRAQSAARLTPEPSGPPCLDEMSMTFGSLDEAERMKSLISETLEAKGFSWSCDVASIIPAHDYMQILLESELINSWNFAIAVLADGSSTQVRQTYKESVGFNLPLPSNCVRLSGRP